MERRKERDRIVYYTYVPALLGAVLGTLVFLIGVEWINGGWLERGLEDYQINVVMNLPLWKISLYILKRRGGQILLFVLLTVLISYSVTAFFYNLLFGLYYGMITASLLVKFGMAGLFYSFSCFFPHYLFYLIAIYLIGKWISSNALKRKMCYGNGNKLQFFVEFLVIFFLILLAVFWEIKFQKNFLELFYQHLV